MNESHFSTESFFSFNLKDEMFSLPVKYVKEVFGDKVACGGGKHTRVARVGVASGGNAHAGRHDKQCNNNLFHNL